VQTSKKALYPKRPNFDEADVSDKPSFLRDEPRVTAEKRAYYNESYRHRLRSLKAVDEVIVNRLLNTLIDVGELDNTYIIFTSDNGIHMGEHRLRKGKGMAYEEDIHVPMVIREPDVRQGAVCQEIALNTDLAPTMADIAGVEPPRTPTSVRSYRFLGVKSPRGANTSSPRGGPATIPTAPTTRSARPKRRPTSSTKTGIRNTTIRLPTPTSLLRQHVP
jgi:arylsulfatase A-like enzyme